MKVFPFVLIVALKGKKKKKFVETEIGKSNSGGIFFWKQVKTQRDIAQDDLKK